MYVCMNARSALASQAKLSKVYGHCLFVCVDLAYDENDV